MFSLHVAETRAISGQIGHLARKLTFKHFPSRFILYKLLMLIYGREGEPAGSTVFMPFAYLSRSCLLVLHHCRRLVLHWWVWVHNATTPLAADAKTLHSHSHRFLPGGPSVVHRHCISGGECSGFVKGCSVWKRSTRELLATD